MTAIVTPEERLLEPHGARILLLGPYAVGKSTQAGKIGKSDPDHTLYIDTDNGSLAITDIPMRHARPETWSETLDLIVRCVGPNRSFTPQEPFSQAHFDRVGGFLPDVKTVILDTVTRAAALCFRHVSQQPEALTERGRLDLRNIYGEYARQFLLALHHLQSARGLNVVLIGTSESVTDEYGRVETKLQAEGQRVPREIVGIVDIVITYTWIDFGDGKLTRAFVCTSPNPWGYPAKDRSGRLDQLEPPDLGALIRKILPPLASHGTAVAQASQQSSVVTFTKQAQAEQEKQL